MVDDPEPLSQLTQWLSLPWWLFAITAQILVIVVPFAGLGVLRWWQSGNTGGGAWVHWRPLPERLILISLPAAAGLFIAACALYCLAWWPKPPAPRILEPDTSILCWLYCGVFMTWPWAAAALANGLALIAAGVLLGRSGTRYAGAWMALVAGLVAFPLGVLALYVGAQTLRQTTA